MSRDTEVTALRERVRELEAALGDAIVALEDGSEATKDRYSGIPVECDDWACLEAIRVGMIACRDALPRARAALAAKAGETP